MKCCCLLKTQKCPKYFCEPMVCNKWTGVVLKVLSRYFVFRNGELCKKKKRMYTFCLTQMWLKVNPIGKDPVWSVKRRQTTGSVRSFGFGFWTVACSYRSVKVESMSSFGDAFVGSRPYLSMTPHPLICCSACPLFCMLTLLCAMFSNLWIIYRTCLFNVHLMLYTFSSPYGLFKTRRKKRKKPCSSS